MGSGSRPVKRFTAGRIKGSLSLSCQCRGPAGSLHPSYRGSRPKGVFVARLESGGTEHKTKMPSSLPSRAGRRRAHPERKIVAKKHEPAEEWPNAGRRTKSACGTRGRRERNLSVQFLSSLTHLAAQPSVGDRLRVIPPSVWINIGIGVLALILIVRLWRGLKQFNEYAPYFAAAFATFMILFLWVYNRNEPAFLTPVVEKLTYFFPTKSESEQKLDRMRRSLKDH